MRIRKGTYKISIFMVMVLLVLAAAGGCSGETDHPVQKDEEIKETVDQKEETEIKEETENKETANTEQEEKEETKPEGYAMHMGTVDVKEEIIFEEAFEDARTDYVGRGPAKVEIVSSQAKEGGSSLFVSGRTASWNGATADLTKLLQVNEKYLVNAWVYYDKGPELIQFDCKVEKNRSEYLSFASANTKRGEWTQLKGSIIIPEGTTSASVYFETGFAGGEFIDFYVDSMKIYKEMATVDRGELPALKDAYKDLFSIGVAATAIEIPANRQELISQQFNSLTPGNELKADSILDYNTCISDPKFDDNPAVSFKRAESLLEFAKEAGIPVRGHTLIWHSQTPRWFFTEGYSQDPNAPLVTKELMLKRMENYIKQVLEYTQTNYPGLIYAWDVVNEAVNPSDGQEGGLRSKDSLYYQVIGPEFIEKAFEYARKYADPEVKLFYNDYSTEDKGRMLAIIALAKGLKEKGLIDGIGLQSHFTIDSPSLIDVEASIREYAELGLEIQITELDMGLEENTEEAFLRQAKRYKRAFTIFKNLDETGAANITNVTFWGLSDDISWLNKPSKPSYPLLFDNYLLQKPAFWGVILSPDIPLY